MSGIYPSLNNLYIKTAVGLLALSVTEYLMLYEKYRFETTFTKDTKNKTQPSRHNKMLAMKNCVHDLMGCVCKNTLG